MHHPAIKLCGLTDPASLDAAVALGAAFIGLVFHPASPRCLAPAAARELAGRAGTATAPVGVVADRADGDVDALLAQVPLAYLQLHGSESPARCAELRRRFGVGIIKALKVAEAVDVAAAAAYRGAADWLLFDAKPPQAAADRPGGWGSAFDWSLLAEAPADMPWLLAGGLTPDTVGAAVAATRAPGVDVSSGIESAPGVKAPARMAAFCRAARASAAATAH